MRGKQHTNIIKKKKKKAKVIDRVQPVSLNLLCNVQGLASSPEVQTEEDLLGVFDTTTGPNNDDVDKKNDDPDEKTCSLESCLDELDGCHKKATSDNNDNCHNGECDKSDNGDIDMTKVLFGGDLSMLWEENNDRVDDRKQYRSTKGLNRGNRKNRDEFTIPILKVELARHLHMGKISEYLLKSCSNLRMPSLERWIIDSKLEEKQNKDKHISAYIDPVIPSAAQIQDGPTQRLIQEIEMTPKSVKNKKNESITRLKSDHDRENAEQICQHLCHMSNTASRHLQNLSSHLHNHVINSTALIPWAKSNGETITLEGCDEGISHPTRNDNDVPTKNWKNQATYSLVYTRRTKKRKRANTTNSESNGDQNNNKPFVVKINASHYEKLRYMYNATHCEKEHNNKYTASPWYVHSPSERLKDSKDFAARKLFHHLVFALLLRYSSLAGGQLLKDLRGGGMQGAIHTHVFDFIREQATNLNKMKGKKRSKQCYNLKECFASPLNAYFGNQYASAFSQDLDWHFGSQGDFFSLSSKNDVNDFYSNNSMMEANPPFSPGLMNAMAKRIEEILDTASSQNKNIIFMIVVPTYHKSSTNIVQNFAKYSFNFILQSKYFLKNFIINEREHGYVEGSQHVRPTRYKESPYDTSVLILQSKSKDRSLNTIFQSLIESDDFITGLKKSFASLHSDEIEQRQEKITLASGTR